jgi:hypothetical protein
MEVAHPKQAPTASKQDSGITGWLESRSTILVLVYLLLCLSVLLAMSLRNETDYDAYWHLRMGLDWVEHGLSPWRDHYSFTYPQAPITSPPAVFQAGLYGFYSLFGEYWGFVWTKFAAGLLLLVVTMALLRQLRAPVWLIGLVLLLTVAALQYRAQVRPELFGYSLIVLGFMLYLRAASRWSFGVLTAIAILLLAWTNYHSAVLGFVLFCGLFIDRATDLLKARAVASKWLSWAGWGLVLLLVGFINPELAHPVWQAASFPAEWKELIQEFQPPSDAWRDPKIPILLVVTGVSVILCLRQRRYGYLVVLAVVIYAAASMSRMLAPASITMLCLFSHMASEAHRRLLSRPVRPRWASAIPVMALVLTGATLIVSLLIARHFLLENRHSWTQVPERLLDYMQASGKGGRLYNRYEAGGFLLYRLAPDAQVYIDGRTGILYPVEHARAYVATLRSVEALQDTLQDWDIEHAVVSSHWVDAYRLYSAGFRLEYADIQYSLYQPTGGRLALTGYLYGRPYCWDERLAASLRAESAGFDDGQQAAPAAQIFHRAALSAIDAAEFARHLVQVSPDELEHESIRRLLAFRAFEQGLYDHVLPLLSPIAQRMPKDYLLEALSLARQGDATMAEMRIDAALRIQWHLLEFRDLVLQYRVLQEIQHSGPLKLFDAGYLAGLEEQVRGNLPPSGTTLQPEDFCSMPPPEKVGTAAQQ